SSTSTRTVVLTDRDHFAEARMRNSYLVNARREVRNHVRASMIGDDITGPPGLRFGQIDRRAGNGGAGGVRHRPYETAPDGLGERRARGRKQKQSQHDWFREHSTT